MTLFNSWKAIPGLAEVTGPDHERLFTLNPTDLEVNGLDTTIDYLFFDRKTKITDHYVRQSDTRHISDHLPVVAEFQLYHPDFLVTNACVRQLYCLIILPGQKRPFPINRIDFLAILNYILTTNPYLESYRLIYNCLFRTNSVYEYSLNKRGQNADRLLDRKR